VPSTLEPFAASVGKSDREYWLLSTLAFVVLAFAVLAFAVLAFAVLAYVSDPLRARRAEGNMMFPMAHSACENVSY
jgi:hypothetical protein